ncbi:MAG: DUF1598 domain-containing protein [Pirellula sp.]
MNVSLGWVDASRWMRMRSWCLVAALWMLVPFAPLAIAQVDAPALQREFPELAAALARNDAAAIRQSLDAMPPAGRQRVLTALHAMRVPPAALRAGADQRNENGLGNNAIGNAPGGASLANFSELMNLIETTISPDAWLNAGGTATMLPYRNGVKVNADGVLERLDSSKQKDAPKLREVPANAQPLASPSIALDDLGEWQKSDTLRWISLHQLDRELEAARLEDRSAGIAAELVGGLWRIDYVAFDANTREWLLGGPAGDIASFPNGDLVNRTSKLPPILLEDLLTVAAHVLHQRGEFGCSIDPNPERLVDAYAMAKDPAALKLLRRDPEAWSTKWKSALGMQRATIVGIPDDSPTGLALLVADAHMKRLAFGLEPSVEGVRNYWLEADFAASKQQQSMVRWWFAMSKNRIPYDPQRHLYRFENSNVEVLSETQMLNQSGNRQAAPAPDLAADAFARNFTNHFDKLQTSYPVYGRLRHIVDLAVAMELVRVEIAAGQGERFQVLGRPDVAPRLPTAPKEIDSTVATRRRSDGGVSAIVSGGVSIDPNAIAPRMRIDRGVGSALTVEASPGDEAPSATLDKVFWR